MFTLLTTLYVICALLLTIYAVSQTLLLFIYWRHRRERVIAPSVQDWPTVTVQLPLYNERHVVERLLEACANLDYPRDRLLIQVLDDSNDETVPIVAQLCAKWQRAGVNMRQVRRAERKGYKAGALAYGMTLSQSELFAVFDADFVPPPDFLKHTVSYFSADPTLGMVQTRWGHLNPFDNPLTLGQTLSVDAHFVVEQTARNRAGLLINFNGSGGIWRASCIREAGGWDATTLSEDLDLSYRAQLAGWHFLYLPDVVIPGELPPQMTAYKLQQARWAKGSTQCLTRLLGRVWHATRLSLAQRLVATLHLCQYLPHPLMVLLLLLTPPLILMDAFEKLPLGPLGLAGLGPLLVYVVSQQTLYDDWGKRLLVFPVLMALGTGIAWNNTRAVVSGFMGRHGEFKRTPKFGQAKRANTYALRFDRATWVEVALSLYALWGTVIAVKSYPALAPYLALYAFAFAAVAFWSMSDSAR
ncbi:MAG: glycosyltransferase [Chloroflexi bacterium]|nr:glycosyltransferase [Chloroflexota bacterium]